MILLLLLLLAGCVPPWWPDCTHACGGPPMTASAAREVARG